jgi:nucleotide-binding universal stress UspA family protein
MQFRKILVPTDFSQAASAAFEIAAYEAKMSGSELHLITVVQIPIIPRGTSVPFLSVSQSELEEQIVSATKNDLEKTAREYFHKQDMTLHIVCSLRNPGVEICEFAAQRAMNLIVISSHGGGAISRLVMGSTAERVVRMAQCPVLVAPGFFEKKNASKTEDLNCFSYEYSSTSRDKC